MWKLRTFWVLWKILWQNKIFDIADCRINGEEYPQAEKYLKNYTKTWKKCDIMKFRKQYVIIRNVENREIIN